MLPGESGFSETGLSDTPAAAPVTAIQLRVYQAKTVRLTVKMEPTVKLSIRTDPQMK